MSRKKRFGKYNVSLHVVVAVRTQGQYNLHWTNFLKIFTKPIIQARIKIIARKIVLNKKSTPVSAKTFCSFFFNMQLQCLFKKKTGPICTVNSKFRFNKVQTTIHTTRSNLTIAIGSRVGGCAAFERKGIFSTQFLPSSQ